MSESIRVFENSLRDYLINVQSDSYNTNTKIQYKYNNLKVIMDPQKMIVPHFWVTLGICAVCFNIETLDKISGSLYCDEKHIVNWGRRININTQLKKHWKYLTNAAAYVANPIRQSDDVDQADEIVTGFGINRIKYIVSQIKMELSYV